MYFKNIRLFPCFFFALKKFYCVCRFPWRRHIARIGGAAEPLQGNGAGRDPRNPGKPDLGFVFGFGEGMAVEDGG